MSLLPIFILLLASAHAAPSGDNVPTATARDAAASTMAAQVQLLIVPGVVGVNMVTRALDRVCKCVAVPLPHQIGPGRLLPLVIIFIFI